MTQRMKFQKIFNLSVICKFTEILKMQHFSEISLQKMCKRRKFQKIRLSVSNYSEIRDVSMVNSRLKNILMLAII